MIRHFALVLALTLLAGAVFSANIKLNDEQPLDKEQQMNEEQQPDEEQQLDEEQPLDDEHASPDIEEAKMLLKELEDLVEEKVMVNNNGGEDDMARLSGKRTLPETCQGLSAFRHYPQSDCGRDGVVDIAGHHGVTLEFCAAACCDTLTCLSFQYNTGNNCALKSKLCSAEEKNYASTGNMYDRLVVPVRDPNIALGRPTSQSSVGHGGAPGRAVDGNRSPNWGHNSCTHTNGQNDPWWFVDLGRTATIDHVAIVNRRDCCSERITPFDVHVGDSTNVASNPRCGGHHHFPSTETERVVNCRGLSGRYVGIRLPGKGRVLTLCEVEVYAAPNLALGRPTSQSSVAHSGYAPRATDGCRDPNWGSQSCTHTPAEANPWLQVDLGRSVRVQWVVIINRGDCCSERLSPFTVHIGNNARVDLNRRCGGHHTVPAGKNKEAINCNGMIGRYVGVRLPGGGRILTLCEVEVYAGTVTKRTSEVRGADGKDCGEHEEGDTWVSDEDGHNCVCDEGEELCYKVDCGEDGAQQPIKGEDGLWTCPPEQTEEETEEEARGSFKPWRIG